MVKKPRYRWPTKNEIYHTQMELWQKNSIEACKKGQHKFSIFLSIDPLVQKCTKCGAIREMHSLSTRSRKVDPKTRTH